MSKKIFVVLSVLVIIIGVSLIFYNLINWIHFLTNDDKSISSLASSYLISAGTVFLTVSIALGVLLGVYFLLELLEDTNRNIREQRLSFTNRPLENQKNSSETSTASHLPPTILHETKYHTLVHLYENLMVNVDFNDSVEIGRYINIKNDENGEISIFSGNVKIGKISNSDEIALTTIREHLNGNKPSLAKISAIDPLCATIGLYSL